MEKPVQFAAKLLTLPKWLILVGVSIGLPGCHVFGDASLSKDQESELTTYVQAYHFCVATAARRLDDGRSPIVEIAASAVTYCRPEARSVSLFLDSTKLPDDAKAGYVGELIQTATNKSAVMLRHLRDRDEGVGDI